MKNNKKKMQVKLITCKAVLLASQKTQKVNSRIKMHMNLIEKKKQRELKNKRKIEWTYLTKNIFPA